MFKVIGKFLKLAKPMHIYCLGHYLEGSGELLDLSDKVDWDSITMSSRERITEPYGIATLNRNGEFANHNEDVFNTWGKAVVMLDEVKNPTHGRNQWYYSSDSPIKAIMDTYKFYAWCGNDKHFANCDCKYPRPNWNSTLLKKVIMRKKPIEKMGEFSHKELAIWIHSTARDGMELVMNRTGKKSRIITLSKNQWKGLEVDPDTTVIKISFTRFKEKYQLSLSLSDWIFSRIGKVYQYYAVRS